MANSSIPYQDPSTISRRLDSESLTVASVTVERERVQIAGVGATDIAGVDATNGLDVDVTRVQGTVTAAGNKSSNGGAPGSTNLGTLPCVATAAAPTYTEGNQVGLSVDLAGSLRTSGGGGGGTQYTEDVASVADPIGDQLIARRRDALSPETTTDGDNTALNCTSKGELYVKQTDSVPVTGTVTANAGTNLNTSALALEAGGNLAGAATSLAVLDDWDEVDRAKVNPIAGQAGVQGASGVVTALTQRVVLATDVGLPAGTNNIGDVDVLTLPSLPAGTNNIGDVDVLTLPALPAGTNNIGDVDVLTLPALPAGTNNIGDVDVLSLPSIPAGSNNIGTVDGSNIEGDVAHDGVNSGNPLQIGVEAIAHGANPTAVAAGDRTKLYANRHGILFAMGGHMNLVALAAEYTAAQTDTAIVTVGAGTKIVVTYCKVTADEATTVGTGYYIGFGSTTTPTTTGVVAAHRGLIPGSIDPTGDGSGMMGVGADGEDLRITSEVPTSGGIRVLVKYYTIES